MATTEFHETDLFGGSMGAASVLMAHARAPQGMDEKNLDAFKTISEAASMLAVPQHVLRFWESKFTQLKPLKLKGGRRYYRPQDIEVLFTIKELLYKEGYTIKGARRAIAQKHKKPAKDLQPDMPSLPTPPRTAKPAPAAPLFEAAAVPLPVVRKKEALRQIHGELLQLRAILDGLPSLEKA